MHCYADDHLVMVGVSLADLLLLVFPAISLVLFALQRSWAWQQVAEAGSVFPWTVALTESFTVGCRGYSRKFREDAAKSLLYRRSLKGSSSETCGKALSSPATAVVAHARQDLRSFIPTVRRVLMQFNSRET